MEWLWKSEKVEDLKKNDLQGAVRKLLKEIPEKRGLWWNHLLEILKYTDILRSILIYSWC